MPASIGVNLRVTGHCNQGGRKYMEDVFSVAYQQTEDEKDLEYAFFGIFDGHGGREAAQFAKEHLMDHIVSQKNFWSENDELVLKAISDGFTNTHQSMWKQLENWPRTPSGLPSTSGTTASIVFIRRGKIYIGHVGDSGIVLGMQHEGDIGWEPRPLTRDHKPECAMENERIVQAGGKVVSKSGVPRVVWNRPRLGHKGPVRRSTHIDEIPFLAVARSLGDLWSYNSDQDKFVVSPVPDVSVLPIEVGIHKCLILGTDGLWNMVSPEVAVHTVGSAEKHNEISVARSGDERWHTDNTGKPWVWVNPSKRLVDRALERWSSHCLRADNTSVVTVMLDPPGPPRKQVLRQQQTPTEKCRNVHKMPPRGNKEERSCAKALSSILRPHPHTDTHRVPVLPEDCTSIEDPTLPQQSSGVAIITRHPSTGELTRLQPTRDNKAAIVPEQSLVPGDSPPADSTTFLHDEKIQIPEVSSSVGPSSADSTSPIVTSKIDDDSVSSSSSSTTKRKINVERNIITSSVSSKKRRLRHTNQDEESGASDTENALARNVATGARRGRSRKIALTSERTIRRPTETAATPTPARLLRSSNGCNLVVPTIATPPSTFKSCNINFPMKRKNRSEDYTRTSKVLRTMGQRTAVPMLTRSRVRTQAK